MFIHLKRAVLALVVSVFAVNVYANGDFAAGIKLGKMDPDYGDSETAMGVNLAYMVDSNISAEAEILQADAGAGNVDSVGVYGAYRSDGELYFLGKIGFVDLDGPGISESGLSYGLGGGLRINSKVSVEAEYTSLDSDLKFLGFTARLRF